MSRFKRMVEEAIKRGCELVDKRATEADEYNLEDVIHNHFGDVIWEVMPKRFTMRWAIEMLQEQPRMFTLPVRELGFQPEDMKELVQCAIRELIWTEALKQVEPHARRAGFISQHDPNYFEWAGRRGYL